MRLLRVLCAVLLLAGTTLGASFHSASAHGMTHAGGTTAHVHNHGHQHARSKPCDCPQKASHAALCDMACSAALAVMDEPRQVVGTRLEYLVAFAVPPPGAVQDALRAPDPFPPRRSPIG